MSVYTAQRKALQGMRRDTPLPVQGWAVAFVLSSFSSTVLEPLRQFRKFSVRGERPPVAWSGSNSLSGAPAASSFPSFGLPQQGMVLGELSEDGPGAALPTHHWKPGARAQGLCGGCTIIGSPQDGCFLGESGIYHEAQGMGNVVTVRLSHSQV